MLKDVNDILRSVVFDWLQQTSWHHLDLFKRELVAINIKGVSVSVFVCFVSPVLFKGFGSVVVNPR